MKWTFLIALFLILWLAPISRLHAMEGGGPAKDGPDGEISLMGSYSKTDFGNNSYSTTRRYTATAGYNLTSVTELELSYAYTDTFFSNEPVQTSSINEQTLALSIVQGLLPPKMIVQPYVKAGAAQYNRKQSGTVQDVPTTPSDTKSPSAVLGAGLRIFLLRNFSLKVEAVTYLPNFNISGAKNNYSLQGGIGWEF